MTWQKATIPIMMATASSGPKKTRMYLMAFHIERVLTRVIVIIVENISSEDVFVFCLQVLFLRLKQIADGNLVIVVCCGSRVVFQFYQPECFAAFCYIVFQKLVLCIGSIGVYNRLFYFFVQCQLVLDDGNGLLVKNQIEKHRSDIKRQIITCAFCLE